MPKSTLLLIKKMIKIVRSLCLRWLYPRISHFSSRIYRCALNYNQRFHVS